MEKYILIQRDGVINALKDSVIHTPDDFIFLPFVLESFFSLQQNNIKAIVVTNQEGLSTGELKMQDLSEIHNKMISMVEEAGGKVADILICPHDESKACECRFPQPGLLKHAAEKHGFDLGQTYFLGDRTECLQAAWNAECKAAYVRTGLVYKTRQFLIQSDRQPEINSRDMLDAVMKIVRFYQSE